MSTSTNLPICPGRHRVTDYSRKWFVPRGKTSSECTYCELCFTQFVKDKAPDANDYQMLTNLYQCNCDYPKDYSKYSVEKEGVRVTVMSKDGSKLFEKLENPVANLNGVIHVDVPTCTEYIVNIEHVSDNPDAYITFESGKVGDKDIVFEPGRRIYHPVNIELKGFQTGTNDSFMFMSHSKQEKSEGKKLEGENVRNILSLKVQKYRCERIPVSNRFHNYGLSGSGLSGSGIRTRGLPKGFQSKGGDSDDEPRDCDYMCEEGDDEKDYINEKSMQGGIAEGYQLQCSTIAESSKGPLCGVSTRIAGGSTVSGGSYVAPISATTTNDRFVEVGAPIEFMIQLVCTQSDEEKYKVNREYHLKQEIKERDTLVRKIKSQELNLIYHQSEIERQKKMLETETEKITELRKELHEKYSHLGSADQRDHLIDLSEDSKVISIQENAN